MLNELSVYKLSERKLNIEL